MNTLLLTLGHNSSAIHIRGNTVIAGYEEERFTRKKSESQFPLRAIRKLGLEYYDEILVSHWDPYCNLKNMSYRHWRPDLLPHHGKLISLDKDFTHHDAHMMSALAFHENDDYWTIVADGFGNFGETLSIYKGSKLMFRSHGYMSSLGLMYQYATNHLGLKMNQDEYKLLGYENKISKEDAGIVESVIGRLSNMITIEMNNRGFKTNDPLYSIEALLDVNLAWEKMFEPFEKNRVIVSFIVQSVVELVICNLIKHFNMKNINLVGGLFQNVKLNNTILETINGGLNIMPLSGDQGAALGLYQKQHSDRLILKHLYWGRRTMGVIDRPRTYNYKDIETFMIHCHELIDQGFIVNMVYGSMEFGARALGHTSTIAKPTVENVEYINMINGRSTIMPMGPIMTYLQACMTFPNFSHIRSGEEYMTIALSVKTGSHIGIEGVCHKVPLDDEYTCRAQVIADGHSLFKLVDSLGPLINTSFNIHGVPIVYNNDDTMRCIDYQQKLDHNNRIYNLILIGENHDIY